ncbi:lysylphosphatidylglycerol synthase domain-containing protein [Aeromicrobium choanae]|uniref:Lysylphosphatidylglycerol synthase TM region n=1 Tax=Aeromicrobium choanae TaxID=1736691 RepID=A0A1T4YQZ4_9ACTN|nr:lysylphosphatidylglycerol synthase domain-containing protein [Aeromicrobium choanae]SKB04008.1 Lysylphosphatidylglycerol synthase TM region [Aeromicrobium choanae]
MPDATGARRRWVRLGLIVVLLAVIVVVIRGLLGDIDWEQVRTAIAKLAPWQFAVLVGGLLVRQFLNALPLALFIPGCPPVRAMQNDQAAILMTTVAPPPSDVVLRLAMFGSWGIPASAGLAGTVMNTVTFYVVRFGAPLLGIALMLALGTFHLGEFVPAVVSGSVSAALLAVVWLAFRGEAFTVGFARRLARFVGRMRSGVDPAAWAAWAADFRGRVVDRVPWALPRSVLALVAMVVVDAALIVASLRFVGVTASEVPAIEVLVAFLVAYPLTLFPFSGLGILDAVVVATLLAIEAGANEAELVAGFVIWRTITIAGPLVLGLLSVGLWKLQLLRAG